MKVKPYDRMVVRGFLANVSIISAFFTITFIFVDIPEMRKTQAGILVGLLFILLYLGLWWRYNLLKSVSLSIDGSRVSVRTGDIFKQAGLKAIPFNEYFDTQVDDRIISRHSLNGIFIEKHLSLSTTELDHFLDGYAFDDEDIVEMEVARNGKSKRFRIGTICVIDDYLLVAFAKFDSKNRATLTMPEYLNFLINFWDNVNSVYSQKSVSVPIFGSGITRIKEHKNITDESLLRIMLWTFRISETRFKYPAKLTVVVHEDKIDAINLLDIKSSENGF